MGHEAADRTCREKVAGHSAENPFVQAAVPVSTSDKQVGTFLPGKLDQLDRTDPSW